MPLRLKSLELHGFKTFANRTGFEFAETVTAIVGPNGSGKSNIADSLRWVLGEQSYSLLRAKKTEDMIFSGSESRPRAGMASATVTFDNSDSWLPIDFSEVAITRRAYRDGANEYLVNGQKVRLKDVSELLAQSGLAERTYTIIGQGLVDAALSLKADERRRLFEEAAGIGLHRSRREEALRRLDSTRRNLERVEDILAELKPRLGSLERQARRALEYEQVRGDLQLMLRDWYGFHWHNAQQELAEARGVVQTQESRLERERALQAGLESRWNALREQMSRLRGELNTWRKDLAALHIRREAVMRDLAVAEERQHSVQTQQEAARGELNRLAEEAAFHEESIAAAQTDVERLQADLAEARQQGELARAALSARQKERAEVEKLIAAARQETGQLNSRQGQTQARLAESQAQIGRAQEALEAAGQALSKAERGRDDAAARHEAAQRKAEQAESALHQAEQAAVQAVQAVQAAEAARRKAQEQRAALAADMARAQAQLDVLKGAEAALSGYSAGARRLLQAARQASLSGAKGALSSFIEAPKELEQAVSAALGEFLDGVVLEGDPDQALDLLQEESGRATLLPGDYMTPGARLQAAGEGIVGVAADLVSAPPALQPVLNVLLGQTLLVEDRAAARRALNRFPTATRAVTLKGEIFYAQGPVSGGGGGEAQASQTLLGRARRLRELTAQLSEHRRRLEEMDAALQSQAGELDDLRNHADSFNRQAEAVRRESRTAGQAAQQAQAALEAAERQAQWSLDQRRRQQADLKRSRDDAERLAQDLAGLEERLAQARQTLRQHQSGLEALALDEFQAQMGHWSTRLAVAERAVNDAQARLRERQAALERVKRSAAGLEARLEAQQSAQDDLQAQRTALAEQSAAAAAEITALIAQIEPAEARLVGVEAQGETLQTEEAAARQAVSLAEHTNAQARITLARRQESLDSLRRRVEEDFGLVAFEYDEQISGPTPLPMGGMVEQLPAVKKLTVDIEENIKRQRAQLRRIGAINPEAQAEYHEVKTRYEFLIAQVADLHTAEEDIRQVVDELDQMMQREFRKTFEAVAVEFREIFSRLFGGGSARLLLTDPDDLTTSGIDIEARLPGRRMQGLSLLSGGERSLTAASLVFALLRVSPTPFCVLDEVDAMLDEANVGRFRDLLRELSQRTQFVIVTHNRNTVQAADAIYGVTMGRDSSSQVLSLRLDEVANIIE